MTEAADLARDFVESWNRRDFDHIRELAAEDYVFMGPDGAEQKGVEAGLGVSRMWADAFPDGRIEDIRVHASDGKVTVECVGRGTQTGELMGIAPTGKRVEIPFCEVLEVRDGKVLSEHQYMDLLTLFTQLGVISMPTAA